MDYWPIGASWTHDTVTSAILLQPGTTNHQTQAYAMLSWHATIHQSNVGTQRLDLFVWYNSAGTIPMVAKVQNYVCGYPGNYGTCSVSITDAKVKLQFYGSSTYNIQRASFTVIGTPDTYTGTKTISWIPNGQTLTWTKTGN